MRSVACLLVAALGPMAGPASAQTGPYLAEVATDGVALRSGPGDKMPETGTLRQGTHLFVEREEGDEWLAVQPPGGQVSWIKALFLEPKDGQPSNVVPRNAVVAADADAGAEVAHGRPGLDKPLGTRKTRVPDGTLVLVIGPKVNVDGAGWYPIVPPDGDFRYVPKSAVRMLRGQSGQAFVVNSPTPPPPVAQASATAPGGDTPPALAALPSPGPTPGALAARGDNWPNHPTWRQAEAAERAGDYARAEQLYLKLAGDMNRAGGDADLANLCYNRVHAVREKQRQGGRGSGKAATASRPSGRQDLPDGGGAADDGYKAAGPGRLRVAGFKIGRQTTYALVSAQGRTICYALPGNRVDLDRYVDEDVELYGTVDYPGDQRGAGVMTVTTVRAAR